MHLQGLFELITEVGFECRTDHQLQTMTVMFENGKIVVSDPPNRQYGLNFACHNGQEVYEIYVSQVDDYASQAYLEVINSMYHISMIKNIFDRYFSWTRPEVTYISASEKNTQPRLLFTASSNGLRIDFIFYSCEDNQLVLVDGPNNFLSFNLGEARKVLNSYFDRRLNQKERDKLLLDEFIDYPENGSLLSETISIINQHTFLLNCGEDFLKVNVQSDKILFRKNRSRDLLGWS